MFGVEYARTSGASGENERIRLTTLLAIATAVMSVAYITKYSAQPVTLVPIAEQAVTTTLQKKSRQKHHPHSTQTTSLLPDPIIPESPEIRVT